MEINENKSSNINNYGQIDSNFNNFEEKKEKKMIPYTLGGEILESVAIFAPKTMNDDPMYVQEILNNMKNPLTGCKQVESGGYILDGPPKNNVVPIDIKKKGKK